MDVNSLKRADWSPLMLAATKTGPDAYNSVIALLDAGADTSLRNKDGWTAFHLSSREGDENVISALLQRDPSAWNTVSNNQRTPEHTGTNILLPYILLPSGGSYQVTKAVVLPLKNSLL